MHIYFFIIKTICLAILLALAVVKDIRSSRIPNRLVLLGMGLGVAVSVVEGALLSRLGALPIALGVLFSTMVPFILLIALYKVKALGAGDIKLLMACGAISGFWPIMEIMTYSFIAGGALSLFTMLINKQLGKCAKRFGRYIMACCLQRKLLPYQDVGDEGIQVERFNKVALHGGMIRFSIAIAAGALVFTAQKIIFL